MSDGTVDEFNLLTHILDETRDLPELCSLISGEVGAGRVRVVEVVEGLEGLLTSEDEYRRLRGTEALALVLASLPPPLLPRHDLLFITDFLCDRLKDHFVVTAAVLKGLVSVAGMKNLDDGAPAKILNSLSQNLTCQALPQDARHLYYCILETLMSEKTQVLLKFPGDFVYSVISAMESESDPRNLMKLFGMLPYFLRTFPLKHLSEETFSVLECYFPVDFSPKDKAGITREDLADGLEECLVSTPEFGPYCIPMILEKLDTQLKVAHIDSLKVLIRGCEVWSLESLHENLGDIWGGLRRAVVGGVSEAEAETGAAALAVKALVALVRRLSLSPLDPAQADSLNKLLHDVTASTHGFLSDPELSLFTTATTLLDSLAQASLSACHHILISTVPQLLALLKVGSNKPDQVIQALRPIITASITFGIPKMSEDKESAILSRLPETLLEEVERGRARREVYLCFADMASVLSKPHRLKLYSTIKTTVTKESSPSIRESYAVFVKAMASLYPEEVKCNLLMEDFPSFSRGSVEEAKRTVDIFCWTSHVPPLTVFSLSKIMEKISARSIYTPVVLTSLRSLCENLKDEKTVECIAMDCKVPEGLVRVWLEAGEEAETRALLSNRETLEDLSRTVDAIVKPLPSGSQNRLLADCYKSLFTSLTTAHSSDVELVLLEGLLGSLRRDVRVPDSSLLVSSLMTIAVNRTSRPSRTSACRILATFVNKYEEGPDLNGMLSEAENVVDQNIGTPREGAATDLVCWITKGLCLRAHPQMNTWLDKLMELLRIERVQMEAAQGFHLIMNENEYLLNRSSYCDVRILYKQRVFGVTEKLVKMLDTRDEGVKVAASMAVAYVLQAAPPSLLLSRLTQFVTVMVGCLDSGNTQVVFAVLQVLNGLLSKREPVLEDYTETFVPRCVRSSVFASDMKVRMEALDCIYSYGKYNEISILPYKNLVVNGLIKCLDDRKRLVRHKAVRARTRWFLLGSLPKDS